MQQSLIKLYRVFPLYVLYGVMGLVIPFYVLFDGRGRRASWRFFHERIHYGPLKSALHVYVNMFHMGMVVLDRFAAFAGKKFRIQSGGLELYESLCAREEGFAVLSSHAGNYEIVGYMLRSPKHSNVLVYEGETATMMSNRSRLFEQDNVSMIPVKEDLSHLYLMNNALANGEIVSIPADRVFGSKKMVQAEFLGAPANFPVGPFTVALTRGTTTIVVFNVKTGLKTYKVIVRPLTIPDGGTRQERLASFAQAYARELEDVVRTWPDQWYNFYDFWA